MITYLLITGRWVIASVVPSAHYLCVLWYLKILIQVNVFGVCKVTSLHNFLIINFGRYSMLDFLWFLHWFKASPNIIVESHLFSFFDRSKHAHTYQRGHEDGESHFKTKEEVAIELLWVSVVSYAQVLEQVLELNMDALTAKIFCEA